MSRFVIRPLTSALIVICLLGFTDAFAQDKSISAAYNHCIGPCEEHDAGAKLFCCNGGCDAARDLVGEFGGGEKDAWIMACRNKINSITYCQDRFQRHWNDACTRFVHHYSSQ